MKKTEVLAAIAPHLVRAYAENVRIVATFTYQDKKAWELTSGTQADTFYRVVQEDACTLSCTCKAGVNGKMCKHRAVVAKTIINQADRLRGYVPYTGERSIFRPTLIEGAWYIPTR